MKPNSTKIGPGFYGDSLTRKIIEDRIRQVRGTIPSDIVSQSNKQWEIIYYTGGIDSSGDFDDEDIIKDLTKAGFLILSKPVWHSNVDFGNEDEGSWNVTIASAPNKSVYGIVPIKTSSYAAELIQYINTNRMPFWDKQAANVKIGIETICKNSTDTRKCNQLKELVDIVMWQKEMGSEDIMHNALDKIVTILKTM